VSQPRGRWHHWVKTTRPKKGWNNFSFEEGSLLFGGRGGFHELKINWGRKNAVCEEIYLSSSKKGRNIQKLKKKKRTGEGLKMALEHGSFQEKGSASTPGKKALGGPGLTRSLLTSWGKTALPEVEKNQSVTGVPRRKRINKRNGSNVKKSQS